MKPQAISIFLKCHMWCAFGGISLNLEDEEGINLFRLQISKFMYNKNFMASFSLLLYQDNGLMSCISQFINTQ